MARARAALRAGLRALTSAAGPALAEQRAEVEAIATDPAEPTFGGTVVALERSGALLRRAEHVFWSATASFSTPSLRELEAEIARLGEYLSDPDLFATAPARFDKASAALAEAPLASMALICFSSSPSSAVAFF